jgi:hypothetical protein
MRKTWDELEEQAELIARTAEMLQPTTYGDDVLAMLRLIHKLNLQLVTFAGDLLEVAAVETTLTQRAMAEALQVPASTLRGLRQ